MVFSLALLALLLGTTESVRRGGRGRGEVEGYGFGRHYNGSYTRTNCICSIMQ